MKDVYIRDGSGKRLPPPSHISSFLEPHFEIPDLTTDETFGNDISGITSNEPGSYGNITCSLGAHILMGEIYLMDNIYKGKYYIALGSIIKYDCQRI